MLKEIKKLAEELGTVEACRAELKRIQSIKCRLKKQKVRADYEVEMAKVVAQEQALKEAREYLEPKKTTFTTMSAEDIALLTYDETIRAIKSVQSKKCNSQYLTENIEDNAEYQDAIRLEKMLLEHKKLVKPIEDTVVKKSQVNDLIHQLENVDEMSKDEIVERLKELLA